MSGRTLWRSDGTEAGTFPLVTSTRPGFDPAPTPLSEYRGKLLFRIYTPGLGVDGSCGSTSSRTMGCTAPNPGRSTRGARLVADVEPGPVRSSPRRLGFDPDEDEVFYRSGGYVFFATGERASSLWTLKTGSYCPVP